MSQFQPPALVPPTPQDLASELTRRVIGQPEAAQELIRCYTRYRAGLAPTGRPAGIFLLIGPTGSGKSHLARSFATLATGSADSPLRIDGGEYTEAHEVAKLVGSPPGYLGHRETKPLLSQDQLKKQWSAADQQLSVVLFDEVDKAHPKFWDLLLGILDTGKLTVGDNSTVDFTHSIILMTGNTGARAITEALNPSWGFEAAKGQRPSSAQGSKSAEQAAKRLFRPELFNRIDAVLTFEPLDRAELRSILDLELEDLRTRLGHRAMSLTITDPVGELICNDGFDARYGARHLKRSIVRNLETRLADRIVSGEFVVGDRILARVRAGEVELVLDEARYL